MHVRTLGGLDAGIKPVKPKNLLLLCYLALEGKQDRKHLQMLFWPEAADPATSLRVALSYLQGLGKDLFRSVQNQVEALIQTDAQELMQFYQQQQYSEVIRLYSGAFLKGLDLKNSSTELEDWIFETREKLASLVQWSVLYEAQKVRYSMPDQFQALAEQFFQVDGAPPPTLEMLRFLYGLGLEGYLEHRVLREAAELGVDLTTMQVPQRSNLQTAIRPVQVFVGREQELALLHERLEQTPPGILTVTGLGGVGKSTLVRAYCAEHHPEDTLWLKADGLKDASGLLHQLGLNVQQADPWVGLTDTLRYHKGVVVIDGADQLSGLDHLQNWLRFPDLRVIVTCRQPLQLAEESLLKLEPFSIQEYRGMGLSEVLNHPAVQCFEKHAKRNQAAFKIRPEDAQDVVHLCAALSGLPLALEMASSWTQVLSLKEIREEVQQVVDPEGDPQSLKPIFEASWNLLSEQEKQALTNLNCFLGSFTREAAVIVSGVQLRTLQQLVRKSLLQLEPGQRFRVPQVLKGFVPEPATEIRQKHREYHLHLLNTMEVTLSKGLTEQSGAIPDFMEVIRDNLLNHSVKSMNLLKILDRSTLYYQGLQFYSDVLRNINPIESIDLFIEYAWLCFRVGDILEASRICEKLNKLSLSRKHQMICKNIDASIKFARLRYKNAYDGFKEAYQIAIELDDKERGLLYGLNTLTSGREEMIFDESIANWLMEIAETFGDYYKNYLYYAKLHCRSIYQVTKDDLAFINHVISNCREKEFNDIELYAIYCKLYILEILHHNGEIDLRDLNYFIDIERGEGLAIYQGNKTMRNAINFIDFLLKSGRNCVDLHMYTSHIDKLRRDEDIFNFIIFSVYLVENHFFYSAQFSPLVDTLLKWDAVGELYKIALRKAKEKIVPDIKIKTVEHEKIFSTVMRTLEWFIFKDHLLVQEVDSRHRPHPEATEVRHLLEPHPTSRERFL